MRANLGARQAITNSAFNLVQGSKLAAAIGVKADQPSVGNFFAGVAQQDESSQALGFGGGGGGAGGKKDGATTASTPPKRGRPEMKIAGGEQHGAEGSSAKEQQVSAGTRDTMKADLVNRVHALTDKDNKAMEKVKEAESVQVELVPDGRLLSNADSTHVTPKGEIPKTAKDNSRLGKALRIRTDSRPGSSKNVSIIH